MTTDATAADEALTSPPAPNTLTHPQIVTTLTNAVLERLDEETIGMGTTDYNFDLVR